MLTLNRVFLELAVQEALGLEDYCNLLNRTGNLAQLSDSELIEIAKSV